MSSLIRAATADDLEGILAIHNDAIQTTTAIWNDKPVDLENRRAWFAERTGRGLPVLVAAGNGDVLGYASYGDFRPFDGYRHTVENSVYIRKDRRGRGLGAALMAPLIDIARADGKHVMVAAIEAENAASIRLHARFGFREVGRLPQIGRKFDRWLDLVMMQLTLG